MTDTIITTTQPGIVTATLNRPDVRNALRLAEFERLIEIVDTVADDPDLRVLLLTGAGETFCAGGDLKESADLGPEELAGHPVHRLAERLAGFPKVLIAAVHGAAAGFGATMLLHADAVVAGPRARIGTPFASLGVPAEAGSSLLLPAIAGPAWPSWMGHAVFQIFDRVGGLPMLATALMPADWSATWWTATGRLSWRPRWDWARKSSECRRVRSRATNDCCTPPTSRNCSRPCAASAPNWPPCSLSERDRDIEVTPSG